MRSETSFALDGDLIVIDAIVIGPSGRANIQLVLDTGAVLTTLVPTVAQAIGYSATTSIRPTVTRTAAADEHGYLVQLVELSTSASLYQRYTPTWPTSAMASTGCSG
jgi:hypothetical protein